jgi:hypothetical protein
MILYRKLPEGLKPCPFCNYELFDIIKYSHGWVTKCGNKKCFAEGPQRKTLKLAVKAWNKRAEVK